MLSTTCQAFRFAVCDFEVGVEPTTISVREISSAIELFEKNIWRARSPWQGSCFPSSGIATHHSVQFRHPVIILAVLGFPPLGFKQQRNLLHHKAFEVSPIQETLRAVLLKCGDTATVAVGMSGGALLPLSDKALQLLRNSIPSAQLSTWRMPFILYSVRWVALAPHVPERFASGYGVVLDRRVSPPSFATPGYSCVTTVG